MLNFFSLKKRTELPPSQQGAVTKEKEREGEGERDGEGDKMAFESFEEDVRRWEREHHAICDHCDFAIYGVRFKCLNCPDYDLCEYCESVRGEANTVEKMEVHDPTHLFAKLYIPLPEVSARSPSLLSMLPLSPLPALRATPLEEDYPHRGVICDACDSPIFGIRYKCLHCKNIDVCEDCESHLSDHHFPVPIHPAFVVEPKKPTSKQSDKAFKEFVRSHPVEHVFLKMYRSMQAYEVMPSLLLPAIYASNYRFKVNAHTEIIQQAPAIVVAVAKPPTSHNVFLDRMNKYDIDHVYAIDVESFAAPYDKDYFKRCLYCAHIFTIVARVPLEQQHPTRARSDVPNAVAGYIMFNVSRKRELKITSIAVSNNYRRRGIAEKLMRCAIDKGIDTDARVATLHVNVFNVGAQTLYKRLGFVPVDWVNNYYKEEQDDAMLMELWLQQRPYS